MISIYIEYYLFKFRDKLKEYLDKRKKHYNSKIYTTEQLTDIVLGLILGYVLAWLLMV